MSSFPSHYMHHVIPGINLPIPEPPNHLTISKLAATNTRISSGRFPAFAISFATACHRSPWCGSAARHLATTTCLCSSVPCCASNLYHQPHESPLSGSIWTAFWNQLLAFSTLRSVQNRRATVATTMESCSHFLSASTLRVLRCGRGSIQIASLHT
ncbi:hypothetical protein BC938DRAFT_471269 [Jimgerdemannia flammicorona]|uniref:Uncharacterized protein n=1 Tax=Jimgerdemannia flammicorona TaxID=994334 RepID=A0A433Q8J5_9FUNG|nr:hypothetical protein BC938DRAFT_471269 [Jimgerdemannia flammicorona]